MRQLYMHIGMPKVASSTIQNFLEEKSGELFEKSVFIPEFLGRRNNRLIYSVVKNEFDESDPGILRRNIKEKKDIDRFFGRIKKNIHVNFSKKFRKTVISCEQLASLESKQIAYLKSIFDGYFEEIKIVVYLRRQDLRIVSGYSTKIISGRSGLYHEKFSFPSPKRENLDYYKFLLKWAEVFGKNKIIVRVLDRHSLVGGQVITDFQDAIGEKLADVSDENYTNNQSVSSPLIELVRLVNERLSIESLNEYEKARVGALTQKVSKKCNFAIEKFSPKRSEALAFYDHFKDSNDRVAKEFLGREKLFDENFDMYNESATVAQDEHIKDASIDFLSKLIVDVIRGEG